MITNGVKKRHLRQTDGGRHQLERGEHSKNRDVDDDGDDADDKGGRGRFRILKQQPEFVANTVCFGKLVVGI